MCGRAGDQWLVAYEAEECRELVDKYVSIMEADTVVLPGSNTYSLLLGEIAGGAQYYYDGVVLELDVAVVHRNVSASF